VKLENKNFFILLPATLDPATQRYLLPRDIPESNLQRAYDNNQFDRMENQWQENNREEERAAKGKAKVVSPNNDFYDQASRNWDSIPKPRESQWSQNAPNSNSTDAFPALSAQRVQNRRSYPPENQRNSINEGSLIDLDDEPPVIKRSIRQQNPNKNNYSEGENKPTIGRMYVVVCLT
jgi:hypothetical protein